VPEAYTPKHLAKKILTSKATLEGERKQVTVLFADLKGSMELLADRDPEEARMLLDPVLTLMMDAVHHFEGTVNQVMGDGIMALFGAPVAHEDHAVRACYAALRMQESARKYAEQVRRSHAAVVKIRVGLNSGEVVVRAIGSDLHMDYTAVGQTTHLAARMEQLADPGAIVIPPDTLALAEGYIEVKSLGLVPVKGLAGAVEVYEVTGAGPARTRLQASGRRGLTRFVGRDAELEQVRRAQQLAGSGHGQVAAVVGEAGVGKSRLLYEFTHSHRLQGWLTLEAASVSYGKATSYLPVIDLLKSYFKIQDRDDLRAVREKVTGKLLTLDRALEPTVPALLALLDVPDDDPAWHDLEPGHRRQLTHDAVKRLLLREAREQPLLLIFEDLHWVDRESQALLDGLVEGLPNAHVLLLVNFRPEYEHRWGGKTYYTQLRLDPLLPASARELLDGLLGEDAGTEPLKRVLIERTEGNPFFLEESVRTLIETKVLAGERGAYRLARTLPEIHVPDTVQAILAARIDRLRPDEKRFLQSAAVVGKDFPFALLAVVAEASEEELRRALAGLQAAEFVYETRIFPELEYTFKHALTHEVAVGGILKERGRAMHQRIVAALENLHPERREEHVEQLALHALGGELWKQALDYNRRAGVKALTRSAYAEALAAFQRAVDAAERLSDQRDGREQAIDLRFSIRHCLSSVGQPDKCVEVSHEIVERANALQDARWQAVGMCALANSLYLAGRLREALDAAIKSLPLAEAVGDPSLAVLARWVLAQIYEATADYPAAIHTLEPSLEICAQHPGLRLFGSPFPNSAEAMSRIWLALSLAPQGEIARATDVSEEVIALAEQSGVPWMAVGAWFVRGFVHLNRGEASAAASHLERAFHVCESLSIRVWLVPVAAYLGYAYALGERVAEGREMLRRACHAATTEQRAAQARYLVWLGETEVASGDLAEAAIRASQALDMARARGERGSEASALWLQGNIAAVSTPPSVSSAETRYEEAAAVGETLNMRPLVAHCHFGLGKLYRRAGKGEQAREHLTTATTMYREMGMTYWLEQAEAEKTAIA
jgi:class 3 adenylate cyclase/tetratricopeptide (TPR) repeat protein